jgi:hypothetical protein
MLKQDLCWILARPNSFEMLPVFSQHTDVGLACLPSRRCISTGITPSQAQKTVIITFAPDGGFMNLFFRELVDGAIPLITLLFPMQNDEPRYHLL